MCAIVGKRSFEGDTAAGWSEGTAALSDAAETWHPKALRFYEYWRAICPAGGLPSRACFDPTAIPDLLPGIWLLDVHRAPLRFRYRLVGTRIVQAIGREVTGQWLDEAHPRVVRDPAYLGRYRAVVETGVPSHRRGQIRLWQHDDYREIENVVVPLAADGQAVDILAVLTVLHALDGTAV